LQGPRQFPDDSRVGHFIEIPHHDQVLLSHPGESSPNGGTLVSLEGPRWGVFGHIVDDDVFDFLPVPVESRDVLCEMGILRLPCV
jgi:hypothetical protein